MDQFRDEGGLFAVAGHLRAATVVSLGLRALHHRGSDGAGLVASDGFGLRGVHQLGSAAEIFSATVIQGLPGALAIGQVAHLPGGGIQELPFQARVRGGRCAIAMVGRFVNAVRVRRDLEDRGAVLTTGTDAELLVHLVAQSSQRTVVNRLVDALWKLEGAYAVVMLTEDRLVAIRDPRGVRPLVLGRLDGSTIFATEDAAIHAVGGEVVREVDGGEMVIVDPGGTRSVAPLPRQRRAGCSQEIITLARPDAGAFGSNVHALRHALGSRTAAEQPAGRAELVVAWPDGGEAFANGYARIAGIPWFPALFHPSGPCHEPEADTAEAGVHLRFAAVGGVVAERRVALVLPTLATGRAVRQAIAVLRRAGATEVHVRVGSPQVRAGCAYGVLGPSADEVAAPAGESSALVTRIGADSCGFLSLDGLRAVQQEHGISGACDGCLSGEWPIPLEVDGQLPLFDAS